jgi:hypothetical protein
MIEAAAIPNGPPPFDVFLERLNESDQVDVTLRFEDLLRTGELKVPNEMRELKNGLWEVKTPQVRLPFYWITHPSNGKRTLRITHGFMKGIWGTSNGHPGRKNFDRAFWIREVDQAA